MKDQHNKKTLVVLATGGTGGHIYPANALAEELHNKCDILYTIDERGLKLAPNSLLSTPLIKIHTPKTTGAFVSYAKIFFLFINIIMLLWFFSKRRPGLIVSFGGYSSFATAIAAIILQIPLIIHEQNAIAGKVNRALSYFCKKIAVSFPYTKGFSEKCTRKIIFTGLPLRKQITTHSKTHNTNNFNEKFSILVLGGSQGASVFTGLIPEAIKILPKTLQQKLHVTQQARAEDLEKLISLYEGTFASRNIKIFFDDIADKLQKHDLIISRAGASTIFELILFKKPALLLPLPSAADNHQYYNAKVMSDTGGAIILDQSTITPKTLSNMLEELISSQEKLQNMIAKLTLMNYNPEKAAINLANLILAAL